MLRLDRGTYLSLCFKFIFSERLSDSLLGSDGLFLIIHKYSNHSVL